MPLLKKQPFVPLTIPTDLDPNEDVFFCRQTKELFREYSDFYDRVILLNSLVWSCSITGKSNLTFEEALESEQTAQQSLDSLAGVLEKPLLFLALHTCRSRIDDVVSDIWDFVKRRYFKDEVVECSRGPTRRRARVIDVTYTESASNTTNGVHSCAEGPSTSSAGGGSAPTIDSGPDPCYYNYLLQPLDESEQFTATCDHILRAKGALSRVKLKLFLKNSCEMSESHWKVKADRVEKHSLHTLKFSDIFSGPVPKFASTPLQRRAKSVKTPDVTINKSFSEKLPGKQVNETRKLNGDVIDNTHDESGINSQLSVTASNVLTAEEVLAMKQKAKEERDKERERQQEEKRQQKLLFLEWKKPRDDLCCDDLKPLPMFHVVQLPPNVSSHVFGECLCIMEFLHSFTDILNVRDSFQNGVSLALMFQIISDHSPEGPLFDLLNLLLSAAFTLQEEEDGDEADLADKAETQDCSELENRFYRKLIREATLQSERVRAAHGSSLRDLGLDPYTISEALRLYISCGGYFTGSSTSRFRYQQRGGYRCWDDQALFFRIQERTLCEKMKLQSVYDLLPEDRLKLIRMLCDQIMTYSSYRERIDAMCDKARSIRTDLRQLQALESKHDREAQAARMKITQKLQKLDSTMDNPDTEEETKEKVKERARVQKLIVAENERLRRFSCMRSDVSRKAVRDADDGKSLLIDVNFELFTIAEIDEVRSLQHETFLIEERCLTQEILDTQQNVFLGCDRLFRKYYFVRSIPAILVETEAAELVGACMDCPTPLDKVDEFQELKIDITSDSADHSDYEKKLTELRLKLSCCTADIKLCPVHSMQLSNNETQSPIWFWIDSMERVNDLIAACNKRGFRESELVENLSFMEPVLPNIVVSCSALADLKSFTGTEQPPTSTLEATLRELLLETEEKISSGGLGLLQVTDRNAWRSALENKSFNPHASEIKLGDLVVYTAEEIMHEPAVAQLAVALLQIAQGIDPKCLKPPFADRGATKNKAASHDEAETEDNTNHFEQWQSCLLESSSISQIYLHLSTIEKYVLWSKSLLNIRCRTCRRKGDGTTMLLCNTCEKGYHTFCVNVSKIPDGPWTCKSCQPKKPKTKVAATAKKSEENGKLHFNSEIFSADDDGDSSMYWKQVCSKCGEMVSEKSKVECTSCTGVYHIKCCKSSANIKKGFICRECEMDISEDETSSVHNAHINSATKTKSKKETNGINSQSHSQHSSRTSTPNSRVSDSDRNAVAAKLALCGELLYAMKHHKDAWPFQKPVDRKRVPDYYAVIRRPTDISTMEKKISKGEFENAELFLEEAHRMFDNCRKYNRPDAEVYECGQRLEAFMEGKIVELGLDQSATVVAQTLYVRKRKRPHYEDYFS